MADLAAPDVVFQIGVAPSRIDILTSVSGVEFDEAWAGRLTLQLAGLDVPVIGREAPVPHAATRGRPPSAVAPGPVTVAAAS